VIRRALAAKPVATQPAQKILKLQDDDEQRLRKQRAVIEKYLATEDSKKKYQTPAGKLGTIRALLNAKAFILYPITMISKRVERGEEVDVFDLFNNIVAVVEEKTKADGK
jgi:hypothetical protein